MDPGDEYVEDWIRTHVCLAQLIPSKDEAREEEGQGDRMKGRKASRRQLKAPAARSSVFTQEMASFPQEVDDPSGIATNVTPLHRLATKQFPAMDDTTRAGILLGPLLQSHMPAMHSEEDPSGGSAATVGATSNFATTENVKVFESMIESEVTKVERLARERHVGRVLTPPPPQAGEGLCFPSKRQEGMEGVDGGVGYTFATAPGSVIPSIPAQCSSFSGFAATLLKDYVSDGGRLNLGSAGELIPLAATTTKSSSPVGAPSGIGGGLTLLLNQGFLRPKSDLTVDLDSVQLNQLLPHQRAFLEMGTDLRSETNHNDLGVLNVEASRQLVDALPGSSLDQILGPSPALVALMGGENPQDPPLTIEEMNEQSTAGKERSSRDVEVSVLVQGRKATTNTGSRGVLSKAHGGPLKRNRSEEEDDLLLLDEPEDLEDDDDDFDITSLVDGEEEQEQQKPRGGEEVDDDYSDFDTGVSNLRSFPRGEASLPVPPKNRTLVGGGGSLHGKDESKSYNRSSELTLDLPHDDLPAGMVDPSTLKIGRNGELFTVEPKKPKEKKKSNDKKEGKKTREEEEQQPPHHHHRSSGTSTPVPDQAAKSKKPSRRATPLPQVDAKPPSRKKKEDLALAPLDPYERLEDRGYLSIPREISNLVPSDYGGTASSGAPPGAFGLGTMSGDEQDDNNLLENEEGKEVPDFLMAAIALGWERPPEKKRKR